MSLLTRLLCTQRLCQTQSPEEITEVLEGLKRRCDVLGVAWPESATVDNCCHVRSAIERAFPDIRVLLDVWHFIVRYVKFLNTAKPGTEYGD